MKIHFFTPFTGVRENTNILKSLGSCRVTDMKISSTNSQRGCHINSHHPKSKNTLVARLLPSDRYENIIQTPSVVAILIAITRKMRAIKENNPFMKIHFFTPFTGVREYTNILKSLGSCRVTDMKISSTNSQRGCHMNSHHSQDASD